ncbi:MAG TPA: nickel-dependent hydrogenase large subunit [Nitriliruptorales bacterium]|nr:nickel-dependent hydrogenase large subunit [Nitriliruptorales bacterium]
MCFENLPIVFDEAGEPHLDDSRGFGLERGPRDTPQPDPDPSEAAGREFAIDPVTRVAGALAFHTTVDLHARAVTTAHSQAVLFRGYELILRGRDPLEAIEISSRACGVCGGVHSTCAAMALEMTFGVAPPPLTVIARNLAEAAELLYDHCLHLFLLAGPDYSEEMVTRTNPRLWQRAQRAAAPHARTHGKVTIAEIMTGLNPLRGEFVTEALEVTRAGREIVSLIYGKYPHPSAVVPAGLGTRLDHATLNQVLARMVRLLDYAKRVATLWDDLIEFFYAADPAYRQVGIRQANLISTGIWDDPDVYDAAYAHADTWGRNRLSTPGVVIDGELRTTRLRQIDLGIEEFVDHSFYERWADGATTTPDGAPLSPFHPSNKRTLPRPEATSWKGRYSWATAPRWDRRPAESGPLARQWITVAAGLVETEFIRTEPGLLRITVPESTLPETVITWRVPDVVNAFERLRARAVHVAYCLMAGYTFLLRAFDVFRSERTEMSSAFEVADGVGVGFWEAGRGTLTHYCRVEDARLANYQILTPSTWMASPRDPWGVPGPYEEAVLNTPILEEVSDPDNFVGIDILRTVRSFDPCLPCAVHLHTGGGTVVREATSCACGLD